MKKTIKIGKTEVTLDNNISWLLIYRNQYGRDIVSSLIPIAAAALDVLGGILRDAGVKEGETVDVTEVLKTVDGDTLLDALAHISGVELSDVIGITWALAKCADDTIDTPEKWARQFDAFPLDIVIPELVQLIGKGVVSSKNLKRLKSMKQSLRAIQPASN